MITIKIINNILDKKNRRTVKVDHNPYFRLSDYLSEQNIEAKDKRIILNGVVIKDVDILIVDKSEIIIISDIKDTSDIVTGVLVAGMLVAGYVTGGSSWYAAAALAAAQWGYAKFIAKPNLGKTGNNIDDSSPTYGWDGVQNMQNAGLPVPIVYGEQRTGGNLVNIYTEGNDQVDYVMTGLVSGSNYTVADTASTTKQITLNINSKGWRVSVKSSYPMEATTIVYYKLRTSSTWIVVAETQLGSGKSKTFEKLNLDLGVYDIRFDFFGRASNLTVQSVSGVIAQTTEAVNAEYLNVLYALSEGSVSGVSDVQINENGIENYSTAEVHTRIGDTTQDVISIFPNITTFNPVNTKITKSIPYFYRTLGQKVESVLINLTCPDGLFATNDSGAFNANNITFTIEYKLSSDTTWTALPQQVISTKSRDRVSRFFSVAFPAAGSYDIRITKLTDDPDLRYTYGTLYAKAFNEIQKKSLSYPNTALLGLRILANEQLSGNLPTVTSLVRGMKVPSPGIYNVRVNPSVKLSYDEYYYDPVTESYRTLDGGTTAVISGLEIAYSANPVWCLYDFLTNKRYGLGNYINKEDIDLDSSGYYGSFAEAAKYCDEYVPGTTEKRFRLDIVLDSSASALDLIAQIAQSFRGFVFFSEGKIKVAIDKPEIPVQMFNMGNIINSSFSQNCKSMKDYCNTLDVTYYSKDNNYKQDIVTIEDDEDIEIAGVKRRSIRVFANSESYARRAGEYFLRADKYVNNVISFKAACDAVTCQPGDVISVSHDLNSWSKSGRVIAYNAGTLTIDQDVTIESGKTYEIAIRISSNNALIKKQVLNTAGVIRNILIDTDFDISPANYDIYAISEITQQEKLYRVTSLQRDEDLNVEIVAAEYDARVYQEA